MAEIIDIITKIGFDADTKSLDAAYVGLNKSIKLITEQENSIKRLEQLRLQTDSNNLKRIEAINRAIENRISTISKETAAIKSQVLSNNELRKSIEANVSVLNKAALSANTFVDVNGDLQQSSKQTTFALTNLNYIVQDLPFGFIGISNNISPLFQSFKDLTIQTGSTRAALAALGSAMIGPQGIFLAISVVTSLIVAFGDKLFSLGGEAKKANDDLFGLSKTTKELADAIGKETAELDRLLYVASNTNKSYKERGKAIDDLQNLYPEFLGNLDREKILNGQLDDVYKALTENIIKRAKATQQFNKIAEESQKIAEAQLRLGQINNKSNTAQFFYNPDAERAQQQGAISLSEKRIKYVQKQIDAENSLGASQAFWIDQNAKKQWEANRESERSFATMTEEERKNVERVAKDREKSIKDHQKAYEQLLQEYKESSLKFDSQAVADIEKQLTERSKKISEALGELRKSFDSTLSKEVTGVTLSDSEARSLGFQLENQQAAKKQEEQRQKQEEAERKAIKKRNKERIDATLELAEQIKAIMDQVYARQIQLLDQEISIRRDRVDQAVKLAEYGNVEVLRQEQERLNKAQQEREKVARRQMQINAALQISSAALSAAQAVEGITNAAAKGDPYTTALRVASAVAALGAGILAARAMVQGSFKDGVVDFQGKGTGTSDSNIVRISHGESVVTAKATKQYAPVLEAMNKGINPLPLLASNSLSKIPASNNSYKSLEKRLDYIGSLLEGNGIKVQTAVTNGQIATIVESQRKIEARRWS